jgi:hypothetical protein
MKNKPARNRKLEVRLDETEHELIRKKFGRKAAEAARLFLLGYRVSMPSVTKKQLGLILRALALHRESVLLLRALVTESQGEKAAALLRREEHQFSAVIDICCSHFLNEKKEA